MKLNLRQLNSFKELLPLTEARRSFLVSQLAKCQTLEHDSRLVDEKSAFIALEGEKHSGVDFLSQVAGLSPVVFLDQKHQARFPKQDNFFYLENLAQKKNALALAFYDWPSEKMKVIGLTGTNGKTSVSYILEKIYGFLKIKTGVIGTNNHRYGNKVIPSINTTPPSVDLQKMMRDMVDQETQLLIIEISSHALAKERVAGLQLNSVIWTNLTPEHLDFHETMNHYFESKFKILHLLEKSFKKNKKAFLGLDTLNAFGIEEKMKMFQTFATYHLADRENAFSYAMKSGLEKSYFELSRGEDKWKTTTNLIGNLNGENLALGLMEVVMNEGGGDFNFLRELAKPLEKILIPGRLEKMILKGNRLVLIDYAHTPDALEKSLVAVKELRLPVICLFGCGGDRDKAKRPVMGRIALKHADAIIITSDNPRGEDPDKIMLEIEAGIAQEKALSSQKKHFKIKDRKEAILKGLELLNENEVLLVAGKGHEDYQITQKGKIHLSDREIVEDYLKNST